MGYQAGDRILETTTSTGTGNISLAGAVTGYRSFAAAFVNAGETFPYVIAGSSEWEVGIGTLIAGGASFSRSVFFGSNGTALVNFSAGTKEVWVDWTYQHIGSLTAKNLVLNGGAEIDQIYVGVALTGIINSQSLADNWTTSSSGAAVYTYQQVNDAPPGLKKSIKISITTANAAPAAGDRLIIRNILEGYRIAKLGFGAAGASSISLGFWVKANRTGTYGGSIQEYNTTRSYPFSFTINGSGWEYKSVTIPGDTSGSWNSDSAGGMIIGIAMMAGSGFQGAAGSWSASDFRGVTGQINGVAATSDFMQLTGMSLVASTVPVPQDMSPHAIRPFDEELALSQRYFEKSFQYATAPAQAVASDTGEYYFIAVVAGAVAQRGHMIPFRVRKRIAPSFTLYSPDVAGAEIRDTNAGAQCTGSGAQSFESGFSLNCTGNAATAIGNRLRAHWIADARL
jgi:hypothetical protein